MTAREPSAATRRMAAIMGVGWAWHNRWTRLAVRRELEKK